MKAYGVRRVRVRSVSTGGETLGVSLPRELVRELGIRPGDVVEFHADPARRVIFALVREPQAASEPKPELPEEVRRRLWVWQRMGARG